MDWCRRRLRTRTNAKALCGTSGLKAASRIERVNAGQELGRGHVKPRLAGGFSMSWLSEVVQRLVDPIVFRHLSPAAFCKRNVSTVNLTVNGYDEVR